MLPNFLIVPFESAVSGAKVVFDTVDGSVSTCIINQGSSQSELMMTGLGCWPISSEAVIYAECSTWLDQWEAVEVSWVAVMQWSVL